MPTILDGDIDQQSDLTLRSPDFEHGERMPDYAGYVNDDENPPLSVSGVPDGTASLVLVMDHPDAEPIAGHAWDHWVVWDIDPDVDTIPRDWDAHGATEGLNDYLETGYGGPSPPDEGERYHFKLLALSAPLGAPEGTRKARLASLVALDPAVGAPIAGEAELLGATELVGTFDASQGTLF